MWILLFFYLFIFSLSFVKELHSMCKNDILKLFILKSQPKNTVKRHKDQKQRLLSVTSAVCLSLSVCIQCVFSRDTLAVIM